MFIVSSILSYGSVPDTWHGPLGPHGQTRHFRLPIFKVFKTRALSAISPGLIRPSETWKERRITIQFPSNVPIDQWRIICIGDAAMPNVPMETHKVVTC